MKKVLSVLLIAAAVLGFYGSAVNVNDVLACKDYWEIEGEKTTADLNKLEDGINQLKENEETYLDGVEQIAQGEVDLAQGEIDLEDGKATLAKGEADYAAAPAKLAEGERKLAAGQKELDAGYAEYNKGKSDYAAGKADLASGETKLTGLAALIKGIETVQDGYNTWKKGYDSLKDGRSQLYQGSKGSISDLIQLAAFAPSAEQDAYVAAVNDVAADDEKQTAADYHDFIDSTNTLAVVLPHIQAGVQQTYTSALQLQGGLNQVKDSNLKFAGAVHSYKSQLLSLAKILALAASQSQINDYINAVNGLDTAFGQLQQSIQDNVTAQVTAYMQTQEAQNAIAALIAQGMSQDAAIATVQQAAVETITPQVTAAVSAQADANTEITTAKNGVIGVIGMAVTALAGVNEQVNGESSKIKNVLLPGLTAFNKAATHDAIKTLVSGQDSIADGISQISGGILSSEDLKSAVKDKFGAAAMTALSTYKNSPNPLNTKISDFALFEGQMDKIAPVAPQALALLRQTLADGQKTYDNGKAELAAGAKKLSAAQKQLAAGEKKLAAGRAELAKGYADYAAAAGKLEDGRRQLAEGLQKLMDGRQTLSDGKSKLAEYEDGMDQVRDGLATLIATEPKGGLESILSRLNNEDDFDESDGTLDVDKGLDAVEVGREYQTDNGVLITNELTSRAIGSGLGIGAGVLAILAAILSFIRKYKASGVFALLSAAAGGAESKAKTPDALYFLK